jgi:PAS domain-containing protein
VHHLSDNAPQFLATFVRHRQQLLHQTAAILTPASSDGDGDGKRNGDGDGRHPSSSAAKSNETTARLSQILLASLEVLKAAEEQLLEQQAAALASRGEMERTLTYYRTLFDLAPAALLLTTTDGSIRAANRAAAGILLRDTYHLEGKPISGIVPRESRAEFREQLHRVSITAGVSNWSFMVDRPTDTPLKVTAAVHMVPPSLTGSAALYWQLRPADEVLA